MRFKVERYTLEEGEIDADTYADAVILLKYGHGPVSWMEKGKPTLKIIYDDERDIHEIYSQSKRSN